RYLIPPLFEQGRPAPGHLPDIFPRVRGHRMAKATVEMALHDLEAQRQRVSLSRHLGGRGKRIEVGVSVGIESRPESLVKQVEAYVRAGYRRVKLKVEPGRDRVGLRAVRHAFPELAIWVDANQAYPGGAVQHIRRMAIENRVELVEQPFPEGDMRSHARLLENAPFRVCLDESVTDKTTLNAALEYRALSALNIKPGRVGGLEAARELASRAHRSAVACWVGGMLETGIGRAHNVALASMPLFSLPGDISASDRYYREDLIEPPFELGAGSTLVIPRGPGIGVQVNSARVRRATLRRRRFTPQDP
ncbi:MAG TPA: o-succinylbenzoate synthase, partial [Thermoplasmata archaeon]|nr:o-succinylbenzoate synthase [Thermoplasmata archaeon]